MTFRGAIARDHMQRFLAELDVDELTAPADLPLIEAWIVAIGQLGLRDLKALVARRVNVGDFRQLRYFLDEKGNGCLEAYLAHVEKHPYDDQLFSTQAGDFTFDDMEDIRLTTLTPRRS